MATAAAKPRTTDAPVSGLLSSPVYWYYVLGVLTVCYVRR